MPPIYEVLSFFGTSSGQLGSAHQRASFLFSSFSVVNNCDLHFEILAAYEVTLNKARSNHLKAFRCHCKTVFTMAFSLWVPACMCV